jgi:metaxin
LSGDVDCLKWQAYLVLRGLKGIKVRWDIAHEGSVGGSLPTLHIPDSEALKKSESPEDGTLLAADAIPAWVDMKLGIDGTANPPEGYKDEDARTESIAWVSLLEGIVHAALVSGAFFAILFSCSHCLAYCPTTYSVLAIRSFPAVDAFT